MMSQLLFFSISAVFSILLTPLIIALAKSWNILDIPDGRLKKHKQAVPYLGGAVLYFVISTLGLIFSFDAQLGLFGFVGLSVLFFLGLVDDLWAISPLQKFLGQLVAVSLFLFGGLYIHSGFFPAALDIGVSGFWMLVVINAFNLVDVMDGLATLLGITAIGAFWALSHGLGMPLFEKILLVILGALCGFFLYNKPKARIYLGDAGSLYIGGIVATVSLCFPWGSIIKPLFSSGILRAFFIYFIMIFFTAVPLFELLSLIIIRVSKGLPVYFGSPHHFASYLSKKGWFVWKILLFAGGMSSFFVIISLLLLYGLIGKIIFGILLGIGFLVWNYVVFSAARD